MRGVLLAGGKGTRMGIGSRAVNKHMNLVYDIPMVMYPLLNLKAAGIEDIMIITSEASSGQFMQLLGSGDIVGMNLTYRWQDQPLGIAHALSLGRKYGRNEPIVVILGDNFFRPHPVEAIETWNGSGARVVVRITDRPWEFGIVRVEDGVPVEIVEKPKFYIGNLMVTGLYMYDHEVWEIIDTLEPSDRGELEISSVNSRYLKSGQLDLYYYDGKWLDCGNPQTLLEASNYVKEKGSWAKDLNLQ